ncbi:MAG: hypothetical protein AMJ55_08290 [Gammaproteobacteria bacterium SG8_15]|nr:MAG: hypothetical protein AMJ55_08290 [Gammaproteobacteria bacterium SG8_15]
MSSNDVFGGDNFEDILAAVESLETDDDSPDFPNDLGKVVVSHNESAIDQPFIANIAFEGSTAPATTLEFTSEFDTRKPVAICGTYDDSGEEESFDGAAAANELIDLFYRDEDDQSSASWAELPSPTETFVDETLATREAADDSEPEMPVSGHGIETPAASLIDRPTRKSQTRIFSLYNFSQRLPGVYAGVAAVMAMAGFAYILMFPVLFAIATLNGFEMLNNPFTQTSASLFASLFGISLFLFLMSYRLFDLKFVIPEGITLDEKNAPQLMEKLQSLSKENRIPKIHQVILTRRHELNVVKVPRFGLPIWSRNVLAIGYPLLQTLSPEYFDCALSRRLVQHTKGLGMITNWLSFMRQIWTRYAISLKDRNGVTDLIHYCFFAPYASLYRRFAVYLTQRDELRADEAALTLVNDRDLIKSAQTLRITQAMLIQYYWPKLNDAIQNNLSSPANIRPYFHLPQTLAELLKSEDVETWFIRLGQELVNEGCAEAPFAKRMEQIGHKKVSIPKPFDVNAANHYFGEQYETMTQHMDELWAEEVQKALFIENLESGEVHATLPFRLTIQTA